MKLSLAYEVTSLILSILFGLYLCRSLVDTYQRRHRHEDSTLVVAALRIWRVAFLAFASWRLNRTYRYLRGMRRHACALPRIYRHADPFLGLDWILLIRKGLRTNKLMDLFNHEFEAVGNTFWVNLWGEWSVMTTEPENLKAIHATDFDSWPISGPRLKSTLLSIGPNSIFAVNGKEWQHTRAMIRPAFVRNQISDLECFERHVGNFIAKIPNDGSTIELQGLLYSLTIDSATDFM